MRIEYQHQPSIPDSVSVMSMEDEMMEDVSFVEDRASPIDEQLIAPPNHRHERRQSNGALERKTSAMTRRESVSTKGGSIAFPKIPNEGFTRAKGVEFDLSQPWQRSLLRELHRIEMEGVNKSDPKPELVMLSHSESHDNAIEVDQDGISVGTNASSTCPSKPQLVHRSTLNRKESPKPESLRHHQYTQHALMDDNRDEVAHTELSPQVSRRKREDVVSDTKIQNTRPIPEQLPRNRKPTSDNATTSTPISRAKHIEEDRQAYLEVELSDDPDANMMYSDPACFCWGYNVLDFWLQPTTPQYHRRRLSSRKFSSAKLAEIMETDDEGIDGPGSPRSHRTELDVSAATKDPAAPIASLANNFD